MNDKRAWILPAAANDGSDRLGWIHRFHGVDFCTDGLRLHAMKSPECGVDPIHLFEAQMPVHYTSIDAAELCTTIRAGTVGLRRKDRLLVALGIPEHGTIVLNAWFVLDALTDMEGIVTIGMTTPDAPCLFAASDRAALIMPISGLQGADLVLRATALAAKVVGPESDVRQLGVVLHSGLLSSHYIEVGVAIYDAGGIEWFNPLDTFLNPPAQTDAEKQLAASVKRQAEELDRLRDGFNALERLNREQRERIKVLEGAV